MVMETLPPIRLNLVLLADDSTADSKTFSTPKNCAARCDRPPFPHRSNLQRIRCSLHNSLIFNKHERQYRTLRGSTALAALKWTESAAKKTKKSFRWRKKDELYRTCLHIYPIANS